MTEVPGGDGWRPTIHELMPLVMAAVGGVAKDRETTGTARFKYRGIEDVLEKVQPALIAHSAYIVPHAVEVIADERYQAKGGAQMRNVQLRVTFRAYGPRGDHVQLMAMGEGSDAGDKATAKAESIAQKYALFQAFSIPTEDDPDQHTHERDTPAPPPPGWLEPLVARILELPVEVQSELSAYGQRVGIGDRWQGATEEGRERLHGLVERAEAKAAATAAQDGQEEPAAAPEAGSDPEPQHSPEDAAEGARLAELGKEPL